MRSGGAAKGAVQTEDGIFVTVGTTSFDNLIRAVDDPAFVAEARRRGYRSLTLQLGRGAYLPVRIVPEGQHSATVDGFCITWFTFQPALDTLVAGAALVISHAGAGSIFEALRASRPLLVVVNLDLMDNHQQELAEALAARKHLAFCTALQLLDAFMAFQPAACVPYPRADAAPFTNAVDRLLGFKAT